MSNKKFDLLYKEWWNKNGACKMLHSINPIRMEFIINKINLENKKILDIGCGGGILTESLSKYSQNITGIDISNALIKTAIRHDIKKKIKYFTCDINDFSKLNNKKFDVITCMEVIEHTNNKKNLIKILKYLLKKNGSIFISSVNKNIFSYLYLILFAEFITKKIPKKIHNYNKFITPYNLNKLLKINNLYIDDIKEINYNPITNYSYISDKINFNYIVHIKNNNI